jgi:hypothetical protein
MALEFFRGVRYTGNLATTSSSCFSVAGVLGRILRAFFELFEFSVSWSEDELLKIITGYFPYIGYYFRDGKYTNHKLSVSVIFKYKFNRHPIIKKILILIFFFFKY